MKNYLLYINMLLFTFLWGCSQEEVTFTLGQNGDDVVLTLTLDNSEQISRSADSRAEDDINKVDLFLYTSESSESAICYRENLTTTTTAKGEGITSTTGTDGNVTTTVTVVISSTEASNLGLNAANGTCDAYVIVNNNAVYEKENGKISDTTKSGLKGTVITTDFENKQTSFVMDGVGTISKSGNGFAGNIPLTRTASKITLTITKITDVTEDGVQWEAKTDAMRVFLYNGVKKASINGDCTQESSKYFTSQEGTTFSGTSVPFTQSSPFYSYPSNWGSGDNKDEEAYLVLLLPWTIKDTNIPVNFYYKVPIGSTQSLIRNTHYQISLEVGILGVKDLEDIEDVTLNPKCILLDWNNEEEIVGNLDKAKYLVVDKNDVTVYNKNEVRIGYASSDAINAKITYIRRPDYAKTVAYVDSTTYYGSLSNTSGSTSVSQGTNSLLRICSVAVEGNEIILRHDLVNQSSTSGTNYDYVPYYIWVKVTMDVTVNGESKTFTEWIRYEQYPAMYIKANLNSDYNNDNSINGDIGFVWVNNDRELYGSVNGMSGSAKNANPNMYIITTTSLDKSSEYILGDPRTTEINNLNNNNWATAPAIYNGTHNRKLSYYFPTRSTEDAQNIISPKFRIASSYGVTSSISSTNARYRCASYQEDGYPAGRWRVPTRSEIEYVVRLSAEQKIPTLFNDNGNYWAADNTICVPKSANGGSVDTGNGTSAFVRCVYDEWYWTNTSNKNIFTWGDAPRN